MHLSATAKAIGLGVVSLGSAVAAFAQQAVDDLGQSPTTVLGILGVVVVSLAGSIGYLVRAFVSGAILAERPKAERDQLAEALRESTAAIRAGHRREDHLWRRLGELPPKLDTD